MNTTGDLAVTVKGEALELSLTTDQGGFAVALGEHEALRLVDALWEGLIELQIDPLDGVAEVAELLGLPLATEQEVMTGTDSSRPIEPQNG